MSRRLAVAAVFVATLTAAPDAGGAVGMVGVDSSAFPRIRLTVVTSEPSPVPPRIAENGGRVGGLEALNLASGTSVVLAVDRSQSMFGSALASAREAARLFVARKSPGHRVAVVAFGSSATQLTRFETTAGDADAALASLTVDPRPGTALYEALLLSTAALADEPPGGRVVVLLTDGVDHAGGVTLAEAVGAARRTGAIVYPIAIGRGVSAPPLRRIARATGGRYVRAAAGGALERAYATIADELRRTWRIEYVTAARPGERLRVSVWVPGLGSARAAVALPGASAVAGERGALAGSLAGDLLLGLVVAGLVFGAARGIAGYRRARWLRGRLARRRTHVETPRESLRDRLSGAVSGLLAATERLAGRFGRWQAFERLLQRARVPLRAVELLYAMAGSGLGLALFAALFGPPAFVIVLALVVGATLPLAAVWRRGRRRRRAFEEQLPDLLMTLASALKAGQSFRQGLQTIVDEGEEPARGEFRLVLSESRLGRPLDDALAEMAERVGSRDFTFVVSAVTVQRQVGGSLSGIFDMVAETVRDRQQFARRIKALTATGRLSAYVLVALPIGLALALTAMNGEYMAPLYTTSAGRMMIATGLVMIAIGSVVLRKIVSFKG